MKGRKRWKKEEGGERNITFANVPGSFLSKDSIKHCMHLGLISLHNPTVIKMIIHTN